MTQAQRMALATYNYRLKQEDRYLGSVFVTPQGQREVEAKTAEAYEACVKLGLTYLDGL